MTLSKYLFHRIKVPFSTLHLTEMTFSRWFFVTLNVVFAFLWSSTLSRMQQKVESVLSRNLLSATIARKRRFKCSASRQAQCCQHKEERHERSLEAGLTMRKQY